MAGTTGGGQKTSEGGRGDPQKASPLLQKNTLKGVNFPADKKRLLQQAKENGDPKDVINILNKFEGTEYRSRIDNSKEVGRLE